MDKFFGLNAKIYIVVDLMYDEPILSGSHIEKYYAVGSLSDLSSYNIPVDRTFMSITYAPLSLGIKHIREYSKHPLGTVRQQVYFETCGKTYETLDNILLEKR